LVPLDRFKVPTHYGAVGLLLKLRIRVEFLDFASRRSELTL
jgi:hypothetical protein